MKKIWLLVIPIFLFSIVMDINFHAEEKKTPTKNKETTNTPTQINNSNNIVKYNNFSNTNSLNKNSNIGNNIYVNKKLEYKIEKVKSPKKFLKLYDNNKKVFDKDVNNPKNKIEYDKMEEFIQVRVETLKKFDKIKFKHLSKSKISSIRKQIVTLKNDFNAIEFEKIIQESLLLDEKSGNSIVIMYSLYLIGTIIGYILFTFYTKRFIYRIENIEIVPKMDNSKQKVDMAETKIVNIVANGEDSHLLETLNVAQTMYANNLQLDTKVEEVKSDFQVQMDDWLLKSSEKTTQEEKD